MQSSAYEKVLMLYGIVELSYSIHSLFVVVVILNYV
jgi:hypothetical protein